MESVTQRTLFSRRCLMSFPSTCVAASGSLHQVAPGTAQFRINIAIGCSPSWASRSAASHSGARGSSHAPSGFTKLPSASNMNSPLPSILSFASVGSSAASAGRSKNPPALPAAAFAALNASRVEAAAHADMKSFCARDSGIGHLSPRRHGQAGLPAGLRKRAAQVQTLRWMSYQA